MTWTRRSIILNASFQGKFMMSGIYLQCAQIFCKVSYWSAMKTVEGVDLNMQNKSTENVVENWPCSNSHNFCLEI